MSKPPTVFVYCPTCKENQTCVMVAHSKSWSAKCPVCAKLLVVGSFIGPKRRTLEARR